MSRVLPGTRRLLRGLSAAALLAALPLVATAGPEAFRTSRHADPVSGPFRDRKYRPGTCLQCHGSGGASTMGPSNRMALFAANDDQLCLTCHRSARGSFPDPSLVTRSTHSQSPQVVWPGPVPRARPRGDGGRCLNCHDPHGRVDALGPIPDMLVARGDDLCLACHGAGGGGPDIASELNEISRHPRATGGPVKGGALPGTVCLDCHNPHLARREATGALGGASGLVDGVRRVRLINGAAGSLPRLIPVGPEDRSPTPEYEVCFRCHAGAAGDSATVLAAPAGVALAPPSGAGAVPAAGAIAAVARGQVASDFNPANASYHPVEAPGRDGAIDPAAFAGGWRAGRMISCSDCHGSGNGRVRGPHGSSFPKLLKRRYPVAAQGAQQEPSDLCFDCHAWSAYAAAGAGLAATSSRYAGHTSHAGQGLTCQACHEPHGSPKLPSLLALRTPGLVAYQRDASGGTCTVSCHAKTPPAASYRLAYPR